MRFLDRPFELLAITAVHPMSEETVLQLLDQAGIGWSLVKTLIERGDILEVEYEGRKFYLRKFKHSTL